MNATISFDKVEVATVAQEIMTVRDEIEGLAREHDAVLDSILADARDKPNMQANLFKMMEVLSRQSEWLHLMDQRLRLMEDTIAPGCEAIWTVGCD